jgi:NADH dehydrogenase FAD-containing subunit
MSLQKKNVVIIGGSFAGLSAAHYFLRHVLPSLPYKGDYHLNIVDTSKDFMYRFATPRAVVSAKLMPTSNFFFPIADAFQQYNSKTYTFINAKAVAIDTSARTITLNYEKTGAEPHELSYHALALATGTRTLSPLFSLHTTRDGAEDALKELHKRLPQARSILISGGGPTGVETAGELGEYLNGRTSWFLSKNKKSQVKIRLLSGGKKILPRLRPAIAKQAEKYLAQVGVEVIHGRRAISSRDHDDGTTTVVLENGEVITTDIYIPAAGVQPNTEWLPHTLLNEKGYIHTNRVTLRVDDAGPRVYALGDVGSYTAGGVLDMYVAVPVALTNMKRDLLAAITSENGVPKGKDTPYKPNLSETQLVPVGRGRGVGAFRGWRLPSLVVWFIKGRKYMLNTVAVEIHSGSKWDKERI